MNGSPYPILFLPHFKRLAPLTARLANSMSSFMLLMKYRYSSFRIPPFSSVFFSIIILFSPFQLFSVPTSEYLPFDNILSFPLDHGLFPSSFYNSLFPCFSIETPYLQNILSHLHIMFPGFLSAPTHNPPSTCFPPPKSFMPTSV